MSAAPRPSKEGWLFRQSQWLKDWRRRYVRLEGTVITIAKDETTEPHDRIDLAECLTVKSADEKTGRRYAFEVATPTQVFFFQGSSVAEKDEWIGAVGQAIVALSSATRRREAAADAAAEEEEDEEEEEEDDL